MTDEFTLDEKQLIIRNLENFPHINQIINKDRNFFRKYNASYYQHIPECERDDRLEFTLANILKNIHVPNFLKKLQKLDKMIAQIPPDSKIKFGKKLTQLDFLGTFSEIEVYYNLILRGKKPELEPKISLNGNSVDLGFFLVGKFFLVEVKTPQLSNSINNYINSLPIHRSDPELYIGTGFLDEPNQRFIDATRHNSGLNSDSRDYPRESSRVEQLIFRDFIGGNLRNIDNSFSLPIILIINYERAKSTMTFYYGVLEWLALLMRENPPKEIQGILIYPSIMPLDNISYFFQNPNYDFLFDEIQLFSSLMKTKI
jgi:hypothetical protein